MAEIQRREEEKREEKRRKEMAKLVCVCAALCPDAALTDTACFTSCWNSYSQERLESIDQSLSASCNLLGKSPPTPGKTPPELTDARKAVGNRRRTTSNSRHRYTANRRTAPLTGKNPDLTFVFASTGAIRSTRTPIGCKRSSTSAAARLGSSSFTGGRV